MVNYLKLFVSERHWSWTVLGMVYLMLTLVIRHFLFRALVQETKILDSSLYGTVRKLYLKQSGAGWVVFFISFLGIVLAWINGQNQLMQKHFLILFCLALSLLFFLSLILHLKAFAHALLSVLRQRMGVERDF